MTHLHFIYVDSGDGLSAATPPLHSIEEQYPILQPVLKEDFETIVERAISGGAVSNTANSGASGQLFLIIEQCAVLLGKRCALNLELLTCSSSIFCVRVVKCLDTFDF